MSALSTHPPRTVVICALGMAQVLAWGSSYYLIAVLAAPVAADTGWPLASIGGALSLGLLISGLVSPKVGRLIEAHGGRKVLAASAGLLAAGLVVIGLAPTLPVFMSGWAVLGLAMGAGLYDPAFATLGRLYGEQARPAITQVTLFGGFASTACWPLSALLVEQTGWRSTCLAYAAIALLVILPLYWFGVPPEAPAAPRIAADARTDKAMPRRRWFALVTFATIMTLASVIATVVSVHLLTLLQARGLGLAEAVALGMLIGPAQVSTRVLEAVFGHRYHPVATLLISTVAVAAGLGMLTGDTPASGTGIIAAGLFLYGAGSGIRSIARGTVPLALFGRAGYATLMGRLAMPALAAQAASPAIGAVLMQQFGAAGTMGALCAAAAANIAMTCVLIAAARW